MQWLQRGLTLRRHPPGWHLITDQVVAAVPEMRSFEIGLLQVFLQHTSAALAINENADPDVPRDLEDALNGLAPESADYRHVCEGPDDMPAHIKTALLGSSLSIPIQAGRLALGTWQGIYLCEFRARATPRNLLLTVCGQRAHQGPTESTAAPTRQQ